MSPYHLIKDIDDDHLKKVAKKAYSIYNVLSQIEHFNIKTPDLTNSQEPIHNLDLMKNAASIINFEVMIIAGILENTNEQIDRLKELNKILMI